MRLRAAVSEILADFLHFHILAWNLELKKRPNGYSLSTTVVEIKFIFALRAAVFEIRANLQNFHIWAWNLEFEERSQSCICTPFLLQGDEIKLISLYGQPISRYGLIFKISIFGHEIWKFKTCLKVAYVLSFYLRGSKLSLFLLYGQPFFFEIRLSVEQINIHEIW